MIHPSTRKIRMFYGTVIAATLMTLLPVAPKLYTWSPDWILLWVIAWTVYKPSYLGLGKIFLVGLLVDLLIGETFGLHGLSYVIVGYFSYHTRLLFRYYPVWQQTFLVGLFGLLNAQILYWSNSLLGLEPSNWQYWGQVIGCIVCWPILTFTLRRFARHSTS